jgi:hypothetical protein
MHNQKADTKLNKNSSPRVPITNFVVDPSDSEEDLPKQGSIGNARPITGLSRRTKASSPNASRSSYLKAKGTSDASSTPNYGAKRKSSSTETLRKPFVSDPNTTSPFLRENIFPHYPSSEVSLFPTVFTICFDKVHLQK